MLLLWGHQVNNSSFFQEVYAIFVNNWPSLLYGMWVTLFISLISTFIGLILALLLSIGSQNKYFRWFTKIYVTVFRGTPMMVQGMIIYYGALYAFPGFRWANLPGGNIIAGLIIVSLNTTAYLTETIRGGIQSIDQGQFEAAKCLGFTPWQTMRTIILPQAVRNVVPSIGNEIIVNVKDTSVLNIIPVTELFFITAGIASSTYKYPQAYIVTGLIYLILTTVLSALLRRFEIWWDKSKDSSSDNMASVSSSHLQ